MSKTRHLDRAISMLRAPPRAHPQEDLRPRYERALLGSGWVLKDRTAYCWTYAKESKRIVLEPGDRVFISFDGGNRFSSMPAKGKRNLLLMSSEAGA